MVLFYGQQEYEYDHGEIGKEIKRGVGWVRFIFNSISKDVVRIYRFLTNRVLKVRGDWPLAFGCWLLA